MCFLVLHGHLTLNNRIQFQGSCIVKISCFRNLSYASLFPNTLKCCKVNYQYIDLIKTILNVPVEKLTVVPGKWTAMLIGKNALRARPKRNFCIAYYRTKTSLAYVSRLLKPFLLFIHTVAYAETFHVGGFHSLAYGGHLYLVCVVCDVIIWRQIHVSKPTFWRNLLTQYAYSSTRAPLNLCVIALNINHQRSMLEYRRKIKSTLRHNSS